MTKRLRQLIVTHDKKIHRLLEILPGAFSWSTILMFFAGSFIFPIYVAYLVIIFDIFWLYKSASFALSSIVSHLRLKASQKMDWLGEVKMFPDWRKIRHIVIIPFANEGIHILERAIQSVAKQDFPLKQIIIVAAAEGRYPENVKLVFQLKEKYQNLFSKLIVTVHRLTPKETAGKHSNENYAARLAKKELIDGGKLDINYCTITSSDCDHCFHPKHFSYLAYNFLDNPNRYLRFWQPAVFFYNNFWRLPAIVRVINTLSTMWNGSVLSRKDRLVSCQNYSLSFRLLEKAGYWDPEIIPEDFHLFFKAYYKTKGRVEVEPIYLPVYADAAESATFWGTIKNTYRQFQRWAWGVSDDPNVIKNYLLTPTVSFWDKTIRLIKLMEDHLLMPVNWFFITLGITVPAFFVREFSRTIIGYTLPQLSAFILNICIIFLIIILYLNAKQRPPRPAGFSRLRAILVPFEFILMPISGFIFGTLPSLDAHTRLMLGKYIEYRITEKV